MAMPGASAVRGGGKVVPKPYMVMIAVRDGGRRTSAARNGGRRSTAMRDGGKTTTAMSGMGAAPESRAPPPRPHLLFRSKATRQWVHSFLT